MKKISNSQYALLRPLQIVLVSDQPGASFLPDSIQCFEGSYINHVANIVFIPTLQISKYFPNYKPEVLYSYRCVSGIWAISEEKSLFGVGLTLFKDFFIDSGLFLVKEPIVEYGVSEEMRSFDYLTGKFGWYSVYDTFIRMPVHFIGKRLFNKDWWLNIKQVNKRMMCSWYGAANINYSLTQSVYPSPANMFPSAFLNDTNTKFVTVI